MLKNIAVAPLRAWYWARLNEINFYSYARTDTISSIVLIYMLMLMMLLKLNIKKINSLTLLCASALACCIFLLQPAQAQTTAQNNDGMTVDIVGFASKRISLEVNMQGAPAFHPLFLDYLAQSGKIQAPSASQSYALNYNVQGNRVDAEFVFKEDQRRFSTTIQASSYDELAQRLADFVYERLFNKRGNFSTRLSYIVQNTTGYELLIADSNGKNAKVALRSKSPIISVSWSPDGKKVAYVSFEKSKPTVFIHDISTGQRQEIANYAGNNSAPSWHPKQTHMALALSLDGHTQIYELTLANGQLRRLSQSIAPMIDTEPTYSPDGQWLYFTSDRSGSAQIYRMPAQGEAQQPAQRLTFVDGENTSPRISPDQKTMLFIRNKDGQQLYRYDIATAQSKRISQTFHDENPSFSANGDYVIYATKINGRMVLVASDLDGQAHHVIQSTRGQVKQPAWGPFRD